MNPFDPHAAPQRSENDEWSFEHSHHGGGTRSQQAEVTRVLLIEDNPGDAELIEDLLTITGDDFRISRVTRLQAACDELVDTRFDVAILDLRLPDGEGVDLVERLRAHAGGTPIVVLTGWRQEELASSCLEAGAQDYLLKSEITGNTLRRAIDHAIARARAEELRRRLAHSDRLASLGQLAAGVAHEVNNPAAYIMSNLERVLHRVTGLRNGHEHGAIATDIEEAVRDSLTGVERIRAIVNDLQAFARIDADTSERVDLVELARRTRKIVDNELRHRAEIVEDLQPVPAIMGDRAKLSQVLINLLINAAHAIDERGGDDHRITISTYATETDVVLAVQDTGAGIEPDLLDRIFAPFFTTKEQERGTGLGLAICEDIVRQHGGRIEVHSEVGRGTRFEVRLPIRGEVPVPVERASTAAPNREAGRARILLIDDEPLLRKAVGRLLDPPHEVVQAGSGAEAIAILARDHQFDCIVCDLMMPEVDGLAVYDAVRGRVPELAQKFLFLTGGAFTQRVRDFLDRERPPLLEKPASEDQILGAIDAILRN